MEDYVSLVEALRRQPQETAWLEFKHNNQEPEMIAERISALANGAALDGRPYAYLVWGIDDATHEIIGTEVQLAAIRRGGEELENWLRHQLSPNASFELHSLSTAQGHVELIIISAALGYPVRFQKEEYIRVGSYTKKLKEYPMLAQRLWGKLREGPFEAGIARSGLSLAEVRGLLDCDLYFGMLNYPLPREEAGYAHCLLTEQLVKQEDDGRYAITNLGVLLLAFRLSDFPQLERKMLRVVQYKGKNKAEIQRTRTLDQGYALALTEAVKLLTNLVPSEEPIELRRQERQAYPLAALREAIANALIHQDLLQRGASPVVELFENRIEILNPGRPLVDRMRILDSPPRSRNERLAGIMRRLGFCEELGSGWDRMVIACELQGLPAPRIDIYEDATKVTFFAQLAFADIPLEDKVWSSYLHACVRYVEGEALTNSSLRERFRLQDTNAASISRLIKECVDRGFLKPLDATSSRRHMRYVPFWA